MNMLNWKCEESTGNVEERIREHAGDTDLGAMEGSDIAKGEISPNEQNRTCTFKE